MCGLVSVCNISKKYGVTGLVFKIDVIDGKKWVKFVAMRQDRATLIYDLNNNTIKHNKRNSGELP